MKIRYFLFLSLLGQSLFSQTGIHNYGNLKIHATGGLGFHTNLVNDGSFDNNQGLAGFYSDTPLYLSGAFSPVFYDLEVAVENDLQTDISMQIESSLNFIYGDLHTPRGNENVFVQLWEEAIYNGETNESKVDGYVQIASRQEFSFPVGYDNLLKPLKVEFEDNSAIANCAYFKENPDNPSSFSQDLLRIRKDITIETVTAEEFWYLNTEGNIKITLGIDATSNLNSIAENLENIIVIGWNTENEQWENLGNSFTQGDFSSGVVSSDNFEASQYKFFTFGNVFDLQSSSPGNYLLTPNGDGNNDRLVFEITNQSPNNSLKIYNRAGRLVYEKTNYSDEFDGISNKNIVGKENSLPDGIYFYLIELRDLKTQHQGFFYLVQSGQ